MSNSEENKIHPFAPAAECLYVSTSLDVWDCDDFFPGITKIRDLQIQGAWYRQIEPVYYAWLRKRTAQTIEKLKTAQNVEKTIDSLKVRFKDIHKWTMANVPEKYLIEAGKKMSDTDIKNYE